RRPDHRHNAWRERYRPPHILDVPDAFNLHRNSLLDSRPTCRIPDLANIPRPRGNSFSTDVDVSAPNWGLAFRGIFALVSLRMFCVCIFKPSQLCPVSIAPLEGTFVVNSSRSRHSLSAPGHSDETQPGGGLFAQ